MVCAFIRCPRSPTLTARNDSGGGIAGVCLAIALQQYPNIQVDVYEAAETFKEIGAGVMVWGRSWSILKDLGLAHDMRQSEGFPVDGSKGRDISPSSGNPDRNVTCGIARSNVWLRLSQS